ncbi:hypothetical protein GCM10010358_45170 [Streptomyces minutiscleroticus]|uniref:Uncharacterized protein n=1 Tax=Streptomyces minutiscleroticus TaxID=68238 RepID=A0A918NPX9_9ACTN|nr:hypothetical protein GCM10010358_45170 [Streptomyces minutiscleroticus]
MSTARTSPFRSRAVPTSLVGAYTGRLVRFATCCATGRPATRGCRPVSQEYSTSGRSWSPSCDQDLSTMPSCTPLTFTVGRFASSVPSVTVRGVPWLTK